MANNLVPFEIPANVLAELMELFPNSSNDDLTEGVAQSFAVVTYRGKVWRVRYKGEDRVVKTGEGDPVSSILGVIVKSSPAISKIYYPKAYSEGDDAAPLCFSLDGIRPDAGSLEKQSPTCAACPHNVFGSRITEAGKKAKACTDNRRMAIVPVPDLKNEMYGGPMLLRIPPMSLPELAKYGNALKLNGMIYQTVVTKISFDTEAAYPKLLFQSVRPLTREQALIVRDHMESDNVVRMLMEPVVGDETGAEDGTTAPTNGPAKAAPAPQGVTTQPQKEAAPAPATVLSRKEQGPMERWSAPEKLSSQATNGVTDDLGAGIMMGEEQEEKEEATAAPAKPKETKRTSPAKAAAAPAEVVSTDLNEMITGLLGV